MAYSYKDPLDSQLFKIGFEDDRTPLNAYNLNLILYAIKSIDESFRSSDSTLEQELQTQINEEKTALQNQIETKENAFSVMITDGGGVPQSVIDGTNTNWNGEFEEV